MSLPVATEVQKLAKAIDQAQPGQKPIETALSTSDRVLRRVTDGIYREPWSALRELVSNAYDADATEVSIDTDAPRFERIIIRDNGMGFSAETLAAMIKSIGGSPKRTSIGAQLGVTDLQDPSRSPKGRKLIGKLGIGLFALSQLTHEFQIITKQEGDDTRTVADVLLFRYAEDNTRTGSTAEEEFHTGSVKLWKVPARDKRTHGTEIILRNLLPRTKAELASYELWSVIHSPTPTDVNDDEPDNRERPRYHLGYLNPTLPGEFLEPPALPWKEETSPDGRFAALAMSMFERADEQGVHRPSLENTFDNYLKFLWYLSLAAPLDYLDQHPFDLDNSSGLRVFRLGNTKETGAVELKLKPGQTIREAMHLKSPERGSNLKFKVLVDGVSLKRPIRFTGLPKSSHSVDRPLLFVGTDRPDLSKYPDSVRGGDLAFEGYLLWCPRVVPVEHNGVLIRVNDASGTLFDPTFMKYQVSEQTRMRQASAEIFVTDGLDAALNIDRETFNVAHPHYQYLASWLHNAFKQFATRHKDIAKEARTKKIVAGHMHAQRELTKVVADIVDRWSGGDEAPVKVEFVGQLEAAAASKSRDKLVYSLDEVFAEYEYGQKARLTKSADFGVDQTVMRGVAQVLYAAGVFDRIGRERQQRLLSDLARVIFHRRGP